MNDETLKEYGALVISEPHVWKNSEGKIISTPLSHQNWVKTEPTIQNKEGRWPYRSMIWTRADLEVEQAQIETSDITAVTVRLPHLSILLFSVYVQCADPDALQIAVQNISQTILREKQRVGRLEVIVAGDFNRHDALWGGNKVSDERQGEAEPIITMMSEQGLISLLKR